MNYFVGMGFGWIRYKLALRYVFDGVMYVDAKLFQIRMIWRKPLKYEHTSPDTPTHRARIISAMK